MNSKVDFFFAREKRWGQEFEALRAIILDCGLSEELKWGQACYTSEKRNIVLIHGFKEYCALLFFKGALLPDPKHILIQQTENVQSARQVRFTSVREILKLEKSIKAYIKEAIKLERAGVKFEFKKTTEFKMAAEFENKLDKMPALKKAFKSLTPGRQRGYLLYFSQPKQALTREARVEKCLKKILNGEGLND